jgi:hypothetical protein
MKTALGLLCPLIWALSAVPALGDDSLPLAPGTAVVNGNTSGQTSPKLSVNLDSAPQSFFENANGSPALPAPTDATDSNTSHPGPAKPQP